MDEIAEYTGTIGVSTAVFGGMISVFLSFASVGFDAASDALIGMEVDGSFISIMARDATAQAMTREEIEAKAAQLAEPAQDQIAAALAEADE